jgi:hypothetical protein
MRSTYPKILICLSIFAFICITNSGNRLSAQAADKIYTYKIASSSVNDFVIMSAGTLPAEFTKTILAYMQPGEVALVSDYKVPNVSGAPLRYVIYIPEVVKEKNGSDRNYPASLKYMATSISVNAYARYYEQTPYPVLVIDETDGRIVRETSMPYNQYFIAEFSRQSSPDGCNGWFCLDFLTTDLTRQNYDDMGLWHLITFDKKELYKKAFRDIMAGYWTSLAQNEAENDVIFNVLGQALKEYAPTSPKAAVELLKSLSEHDINQIWGKTHSILQSMGYSKGEAVGMANRVRGVLNRSQKFVTTKPLQAQLEISALTSLIKAAIYISEIEEYPDFTSETLDLILPYIDRNNPDYTVIIEAINDIKAEADDVKRDIADKINQYLASDEFYDDMTNVGVQFGLKVIGTKVAALAAKLAGAAAGGVLTSIASGIGIGLVVADLITNAGEMHDCLELVYYEALIRDQAMIALKNYHDKISSSNFTPRDINSYLDVLGFCQLCSAGKYYNFSRFFEVKGWGLIKLGEILGQEQERLGNIEAFTRECNRYWKYYHDIRNSNFPGTLQAVAEERLNMKKPSTGDESIVFIIDTSGSMEEPSTNPSTKKIDEAKAAFMVLADELEAQKNPAEFSLMIYKGCGNTPIELEFTTDLNRLRDTVSRLRVGDRTPIALSLEKASKYIWENGSGASGKIILLSDGGENCNGDPVGAADRISQTTKPANTKSSVQQSSILPSLFQMQTYVMGPSNLKNIVIDVIGFGIQPGSPVENQLKQIALKGGGTYVPAQDAKQLIKALTVTATGKVVTGGGGSGSAGFLYDPFQQLPFWFVFIISGMIALSLFIMIIIIVLVKRRR